MVTHKYKTNDDIEQEVRESGSLKERLQGCVDRISEMTLNRRRPRVSIPVKWYDDDVFIITTIRDAIDEIESYAQAACSSCGQVDCGQTGEYPCAECGLPTLWDDVPETVEKNQCS